MGSGLVGVVGILELLPAFIRDPTQREEKAGSFLPFGVRSTDSDKKWICKRLEIRKVVIVTQQIFRAFLRSLDRKCLFQPRCSRARRRRLGSGSHDAGEDLCEFRERMQVQPVATPGYIGRAHGGGERSEVVSVAVNSGNPSSIIFAIRY